MVQVLKGPSLAGAESLAGPAKESAHSAVFKRQHAPGWSRLRDTDTQQAQGLCLECPGNRGDQLAGVPTPPGGQIYDLPFSRLKDPPAWCSGVKGHRSLGPLTSTPSTTVRPRTVPSPPPPLARELPFPEDADAKSRTPTGGSRTWRSFAVPRSSPPSHERTLVIIVSPVSSTHSNSAPLLLKKHRSREILRKLTEPEAACRSLPFCGHR